MVTIFLTALALRLWMPQIYGDKMKFIDRDAKEYYEMATTDKIPDGLKERGITGFWQRTPAYVGYLKMTGASIYLQVLISALSVALLWKLDAIAGWMLAFYPPHIYYAGIYWKYTLLVACVLGVIYLLRKKHWLWTLGGILLVMLPFQSFGGVAEWNASKPYTFFQNVWIIWRPNYYFLSMFEKFWATGIGVLPHFLLVGLFWWKSNKMDWPFWLAVIVTVVFGFLNGNPLYIEPLIPGMFLVVAQEMKNWRLRLA